MDKAAGSSGNGGGASPGKPPGERIPWWEDVVILLAIAALWPGIVGWPGAWWPVVTWLVLLLMVVVFVRRLRRLWRLRRLQADEARRLMFPGGEGPLQP